MITKIEVDGFKSLKQFKLELKQGLNVLVGPNGVGKTNITLFFEFLAQLVALPVGDAVRLVGGAGTIFQKIGEQDYSPTIKGTVHGCAFAGQKFMSYRWQFEIGISAAKDKVFYAHQEIRMRYSDEFVGGRAKSRPDEEWPFIVIHHAEAEDRCEIELRKFNRKIVQNRLPRGNSKNRRVILNQIREFLSGLDPANNSMIDIFSPYLGYFYKIRKDLRDGQTFNVIPSRVRESEDSAMTPGIRRDGSGLAATLYAIRRGTYTPITADPKLRFDPTWGDRFDPDTWDRIVGYLQSANSTISSIDVANDPFDNRLVVRVTVGSGDYSAMLPLSAMSDGTIKWLALITAILTSESIFSIEEPENFLHPWMQAEIASIMREHIEARLLPAFVLMTTHSESLLNFLRPEEIVIVDMSNGITSARRLKRVKAVKDAISTSGFGLGHFYFSNALSDA